jgi:hypothetical protein
MSSLIWWLSLQQPYEGGSGGEDTNAWEWSTGNSINWSSSTEMDY